jgi:hypothetical protein
VLLDDDDLAVMVRMPIAMMSAFLDHDLFAFGLGRSQGRDECNGGQCRQRKNDLAHSSSSPVFLPAGKLITRVGVPCAWILSAERLFRIRRMLACGTGAFAVTTLKHASLDASDIGGARHASVLERPDEARRLMRDFLVK